MKRIIVGLLTAFLMSAGFVGVTNSAATAADCPYTGCVATEFVKGVVNDTKKPGRVRAKFKVRTVGNAVPRGTIKIIIECGNETWFKTRDYPGAASVTFRGLPKGDCTVTFKFIPAEGSAFERSSETSTFTVN